MLLWFGDRRGRILFIFHSIFTMVLGRIETEWNEGDFPHLPYPHTHPMQSLPCCPGPPPSGAFSHNSQACTDESSPKAHRIQVASCAFWSLDKYLAAGIYTTTYQMNQFHTLKVLRAPPSHPCLDTEKRFHLFSLFSVFHTTSLIRKNKCAI